MRNAKLVSVKVLHGVCHMVVVVGERVVHFVMRRRFLVSAGGICIMYGATVMLHEEPVWIGHSLWECMCFTIHSIAAIPILKPFEYYVEFLIANSSSQAVEIAEEVAG